MRKNQKHTELAKKRISDAKKGTKHSVKTKKKIQRAMFLSLNKDRIIY